MVSRLRTAVPRFLAPANVLLRRAQLSLMLATLLPTILMTALGIVILAVGGGSKSIVVGLLVIVFCTTSITGYILGSIFVSKGAQQARFQNDFLNSVSHELRTPLTSISMFIEALSDDRLTDEAEKELCLRQMSREVERLSGLVERLLSLSRIETGQSKLHREPLLVSDVIADAVAVFEVATLTEKVDVEIIESSDSLKILGDRDALASAVSNLLVNAWKYSNPKNRHIRLLTRADDKGVEIVVIDNGLGIPKEEQRQIFERFERGKAAIDGPQVGSGLGLAIVRAVVRAHRGKVELHSREGQGAEFKIKLKRLR